MWNVPWLSDDEFWARIVQRQPSALGNTLSGSEHHVLNGACHVSRAEGSWGSLLYLHAYSLLSAAWDVSSQGGCEEVGKW